MPSAVGSGPTKRKCLTLMVLSSSDSVASHSPGSLPVVTHPLLLAKGKVEGTQIDSLGQQPEERWNWVLCQHKLLLPASLSVSLLSKKQPSLHVLFSKK